MKLRFSLELPIRPFLRDHCVEGKAVFPAVESLAAPAGEKSETYFARVTPAEGGRGFLMFDAWIFDREEMLCESIHGLRMSDIFRGRLQPPHWIREGT